MLLMLSVLTSGCPAEPLVPGEIPSPAIGQMIQIEGFEIDATEVTRGQYNEFLASFPELSRDGDCVWNEQYEPECTWDALERDDLPVTCIDWCDARDFCAWAGKRLCDGDRGNPGADEWYLACSGAENWNYPYGRDYSAFSCNGWDAGLGRAAPVAQFPGCIGSYDGLFDMSGNVLEWTGACGPGSGDAVICTLRGGSFMNNEDVMRCDADYGNDTSRDLANTLIGFRCCR
jgi:formylglycine-generating enzyme required for sulfatase activity